MRNYDPDKDGAVLIESLESAIQNEYEINEWPASKIASDINQYDSYFENINHESLIKPIQAWLDKRFPSRDDDLIKEIQDYANKKKQFALIWDEEHVSICWAENEEDAELIFRWNGDNIEDYQELDIQEVQVCYITEDESASILHEAVSEIRQKEGKWIS